VSLSTFLSTREGGRVERRGGLKRESLIFFLFVCFARGGGKKKRESPPGGGGDLYNNKIRER